MTTGGLSDLRDRSLLVPGGAGFIGSAFVLGALAAGARRVVVLDALTYAGNLENLAVVAGDPRLAFVRGDIGDAALASRLLADGRPDAVVNFAAETHVDRSLAGPDAFVRANVVALHTFLQSLRAWHDALPDSERSTFRFVHVSTDEVYGPLPHPERAHEGSPIAPSSPYAASKAAGDAYVHAWFVSYGVPGIVTRGSNTYGPRQFPEKLVPVLIHAGAAGRPMPIYGDGLHVRDWLHVDDHCAGIARALTRGRPGRVYHLGGGEERTNLEILGLVADALDAMRPGRAHRELRAFVEDRRGHDRRYGLDVTRARTELGWTPGRALADGLADTVAWYLEHPGWCGRVEAGAHSGITTLAQAKALA